MEYNFGQIEQKWQQRWEEGGVFHVSEDTSKPKFYVLDMFPYPSGAGLHVGHPLGYIASDIYARYMRHCGYNVLHPMGFDAFGLPAEQYAIQTGQHPAQTTEKNTETYRRQLRRLGLSFDWSREVCTCDPAYYKWTQWMFIQLFNSWYDVDKQKAEPIESLINHLSKYGTDGLRAAETEPLMLTAQDWTDLDDAGRQKVLLNYRLAFLSDAVVNWCPAMGTVLANDEVKDGRSERGGHPVVQKRMKQWMLRITAYAQRLLNGLEKIDWSESLKEMQRTWIGRSEGASVEFPVYDSPETIRVFTTRPDTIFGATFMVLAPEHDLVRKIVTPDQISAVEKYIEETEKRTERERMAEKKVTGVFTGAYALNPFTEKRLPVWIADYVLAGYGTGSIMAVPSGDQRDWEFATRFDLPIIPVVEGTDITKGAHEPKEGKMINSGFLNGLQIEKAISVILDEMETKGIGQREINFRLRDAVFGRQRYWGEPFPVYYKDGAPYAMDESELPLTLPEVDKYLPTEKGDPPLARAGNWASPQGYPLETTTMPGWAGSSWYYLRYMDPHNTDAFAGRDKIDYWQNIDLYLGGAEHATGHLLYFRFWCKFLYDLGYLPFDEPAKKLINQGMITGISKLIYHNNEHRIAISADVYNAWLEKEEGWESSTNTKDDLQKVDELISRGFTIEDFKSSQRALVDFVNKDDVLDVEKFKQWPVVRDEFSDFEFFMGSDNTFTCTPLIEKMSKSRYNVANPDEIYKRYGADTLRLYEMFLGPIEQHKPWDTEGIEGTYRFLKKLWKLYHSEGGVCVTDEEPGEEELRILHKTIKKVRNDIATFSFNTAVSEFMICVNGLSALNCRKRAILEPLAVLLSPFAPHMAEELWELMGHSASISNAAFPEWEEQYLLEHTFAYPVSFNGKMRFKIELPLNLSPPEIEKAVLAHEKAEKYLQGQLPKKVIVVPGRIVNVVI